MTDPTVPTLVSNPSSLALEGVSVCTDCGGLFEEHASGGRPGPQTCTCPNDAEAPVWPGYDFNEWIRLCDCCGSVALRSGSRWSTWFCDACQAEVLEFHRELGRTVIPVGPHSMQSGIAIAAGNPEGEFLEDDLIDQVEQAVAFLVDGGRRVEEHKRDQMRSLFFELLRSEVESLPLDEYLGYVEEEADLLFEYQPPFDRLMGVFADQILPVPSESVALQERIDDAARTFVECLSEAEISDAFESGYRGLDQLAWEWAVYCANEILPDLDLLGDSTRVVEHTAPTRKAMVDAVVTLLCNAHGAPDVPALPDPPNDCDVEAGDVGCIEHRTIPDDSEYVGSEDGGGHAGIWWDSYYLSTDESRSTWTLWASCMEYETNDEGFVQVAQCRCEEAPAWQVAGWLLHAWWERLRDHYEHGCGGRMVRAGLLSLDLCDLVAARVWPAKEVER